MAGNLNNIYDEIGVLETLCGSENVKLVKKDKLKILSIRLNEKIELKFYLQYEYPRIPPNSMKIIHQKGENIDDEQQIDNFFRETNFTLNDVIDGAGKRCCVVRVYEKFAEIIRKNKTILESLRSLDFTCGDNDPLDLEVQKLQINKKKEEQNKKQSSIIVNEEDLKTRKHNEKKDSKTVKKHKKQQSDSDEDEEKQKQKFKGAEILFQRFKWDPSVDIDKVTIGYLDRFKGIMEIKFSEFKGVHEDREGVPIHRIRYYKINDKIVWDRENKIDLLTGHEIGHYFDGSSSSSSVITSSDNTEKSTHTKKGQVKEMIKEMNVYQYDSSKSIWIDADSVGSKQKNTLSPYFDNFKMISYNVLSSHNLINHIKLATHNGGTGLEKLNTIDRISKIVQTLVKSEADFISLQECDLETENKLKEHPDIQRNYYVFSTNEINDNTNCVTFCKHKPIWHGALKLSENGTKLATMIKIEARIQSSRRPTNILLINIHLTSNMSKDANAKRAEQLEKLANYLVDNNYRDCEYCFIAGDFNFDDSSVLDLVALSKTLIKNNFKDLCETGYTFDPTTNFTAAISSQTQKARRMDRIFLRNLKENYTIQSKRLLNTAPLVLENKDNIYYEPHASIQFYNKDNEVVLNDTININQENIDPSKFYLNVSDHYALEICIQFNNSLHASRINHQAALAIIAPKQFNEVVQSIREKHDRTYDRWPPHINMIYPFYKDIDIDAMAPEIFNVLSNFEPFQLQMSKVNFFGNNNVVYMEPEKQDATNISNIQSAMSDLFDELNAKGGSKKSFTPHMTIAQPEDRNKAPRNWAKDLSEKLKTQFGSKLSINFSIDCLYWITRDGDAPFRTRFIFPLGNRYPSIKSSLLLTNQDKYGILGYLSDKNMISTESENETLMEGYQNLVSHINNSLYKLKNVSNEQKATELNTAKKNAISYESNLAYYHRVMPLGSFMYGIKSHDIDLIIIRDKPVNQTQFENDFDRPSNKFTESLSKELAKNNDYHLVRNIPDARIPIIEITLKDDAENLLVQNEVNMIDIQLHELPNYEFHLNNYNRNFNLDNEKYMKAISNIYTDYDSIFILSSIFEGDNLKKYVTHYKDFQVLLSFVKHWAESKGIYGKAFGYIGGISYAIMVAYFLHNNNSKLQHVLEIDNSNKRFFTIICDFFTYYASFNWNQQILSIVDLNKVEDDTRQYPECRCKTPITILQSVFPYHNTTKNISERVSKIIVKEFENAGKFINEWLKNKNNMDDNCLMYEFSEKLCEKYKFDEKVAMKLKFQVNYENKNDLHHVFSIMKSKTQGLVTNIERMFHGEIRVFPDLIVKSDSNGRFKNLAEYIILLKNDFEISINTKDQIISTCNTFCSDVLNKCQTSQTEIKFTSD